MVLFPFGELTGEKTMNCIEFIQGPILPDYIFKLIDMHSAYAGAMLTFYDRVREEGMAKKKVVAVDYETDTEMSQIALNEMLKEYDEKKLIRLNVLHSLGKVPGGEICFVVILETEHRNEAFATLPGFINDFKTRIPIFGKEIFEDDSYMWKINK
jgi:molybdopterin synthase catalytic subunit